MAVIKHRLGRQKAHRRGLHTGDPIATALSPLVEKMASRGYPGRIEWRKRVGKMRKDAEVLLAQRRGR